MADVSFASMLYNLDRTMPYFFKILTAGTYLMGVSFAFKAIFTLKEYGEMRMMMSSNTNIGKPLAAILVASALLYWPSMLHVFMNTVYNYSSPLSYSSSEDYSYTDLMNIVGHIVQFIGFIAFVRGWVIISRFGSQHAQPGNFGKGLTHIVGGLLAVNIFATVSILNSILGVNA